MGDFRLADHRVATLVGHIVLFSLASPSPKEVNKLELCLET